MIISHRHRFVILAPWKAATQTTRARLGVYCESPYDVFYELNPVLKRVVHQHMTYADFCALPESRLGLRTAAFVRNPYDRVYSGFRQLQKDIKQQPMSDFPSPAVRRLVMDQLSENFAQLCRAGFQFDAWLELIEDHQIFEAGRNTSFPLHPAHYWTHHSGAQAVDFIGRVENFEADFARLCDQFGIVAETHVNANVDTPDAEMAGDEYGYRYLDRMSDRARQRINDLFREDFELFGYRRVE